MFEQEASLIEAGLFFDQIQKISSQNLAHCLIFLTQLLRDSRCSPFGHLASAPA